VERGTHASAATGGGGSCGARCRQLLVPCWALELSGGRRDREINQPERGENERERVNSRE
jgi:hypothetical protein